jgi:alkylhydroperoxidase family enzyme
VPIPTGLMATLAFLEKMTLRPRDLTPEDARTVLRAGVTAEALTDAVAVASLFNIITRYADALDFAIPTADEFDRAGNMLLKRGYWSL